MTSNNETDDLAVFENETSYINRKMTLYVKKDEKEEEKDPNETEELLTKGKVSKSLYLKYFTSGSSCFALSVMTLCFILSQLNISGFDFWLSYWLV